MVGPTNLESLYMLFMTHRSDHSFRVSMALADPLYAKKRKQSGKANGN